MNDGEERGAGTLEQTTAIIIKQRAGLVKVDLIEEVSRVVEIPRKEAAVVVELIFDSMVRALRRGEKVEVRGFGSFRTRQRRGHIGRNPKTDARVEVPPKKIPYFKSSKELHALVNRISTSKLS
jgi:integration host factor subunit beta